jgi:hypothetical protein
MTTPQTAATLAFITAAQARIEGMIALNKERESNGYAMAYDDAAFFEEAANLERLAHDCLNQPPQ